MVSMHAGGLESVGIDLKSGDLVNAWIEYNSLTKGFNIWVLYSNLGPKDPLLSLDLDLDQFVNDLMYVGCSSSMQESTKVHNLQWRILALPLTPIRRLHHRLQL
ncbi:hypothetical protein K1719_022976 [Acacia pycnantha]|nr:hypothetical protein K1719_022976 [Acacia pycnantha]